MKNPTFYTGIIQINYLSSLKTRPFVSIEDSKCQSAFFADSQINNLYAMLFIIADWQTRSECKRRIRDLTHTYEDIMKENGFSWWLGTRNIYAFYLRSKILYCIQHLVQCYFISNWTYNFEKKLGMCYGLFPGLAKNYDWC
jgi:hypothetical protein